MHTMAVVYFLTLLGLKNVNVTMYVCMYVCVFLSMLDLVIVHFFMYIGFYGTVLLFFNVQMFKSYAQFMQQQYVSMSIFCIYIKCG